MFLTSRPSDCMRVIIPFSRRWKLSLGRGTHSLSSSMTKKQCAAPTTSSTFGPRRCLRRRGRRYGSILEIVANPNSLTGRCLKHPMIHLFRGLRRSLFNAPAWIEVAGARLHNLKNLDARFPINRLTVVTGISGRQEHSALAGIAGAVREALQRKSATAQRARTSAPETTHLGAHDEEPSYSGGLGGRSIFQLARPRVQFRQPISRSLMRFARSMPLFPLHACADIASRFSFNNEGVCESCQGQESSSSR